MATSRVANSVTLVRRQAISSFYQYQPIPLDSVEQRSQSHGSFPQSDWIHMICMVQMDCGTGAEDDVQVSHSGILISRLTSQFSAAH